MPDASNPRTLTPGEAELVLGDHWATLSSDAKQQIAKTDSQGRTTYPTDKLLQAAKRALPKYEITQPDQAWLANLEKIRAARLADRRRVLKKGLAYVGTGLIGAGIGGAGGDAYKAGRGAASRLIRFAMGTGQGADLPVVPNGAFIEQLIGNDSCLLAPASFNSRADEAYGQYSSVYTAHGAQVFEELFRKRFSRNIETVTERFIECPPGSDLLIVGGPVSSEHTRTLFEYETKPTPDNRVIPHFKSAGQLRWGFFVGDRDYGDWGEAQPLTARRYDHQSRTFHRRPLYGIFDRDTGLIHRPRVEGPDHQLRTNYLLISRIPLDEHKQSFATNIAGMHGYSLFTMGRDWEEFQHHINTVADRYNAYQILIPERIDSNWHTVFDYGAMQVHPLEHAI